MGREVLSLKSIYKFLTLNDYPVYSEGIIKKDNRAGLTLTKFCLVNILVEFKNGKTGKIIWRTEGSRNRYVSEICNRSDRLSLYREYAEEVMKAADYDTVLHQIRQYMSFLLERQYNTENFSKKVPAMIEMYEINDEAFTQDAVEFFYGAMENRKTLEGQGLIVDTFCCGWILTMFTLHALMGNGEGEEHLHRLRADKNYSLLEMLKRYQESENVIKKEVFLLTDPKTEFDSVLLKPGHFFGREVELFELREMLAHGGSYLISGGEGRGKTELLRQFAKICKEEALVDYIGIVFYQEEQAFKDKWNEMLETIKANENAKVLLIIDNIEKEIVEKEIEKLFHLPITFFVTSRCQRLRGFKTYYLKPIGQDAACLIFRDIYGSYLDEEDKLSLDEIVTEDLCSDILKLRLLAKNAKKNGWSLQKIKEFK